MGGNAAMKSPVAIDLKKRKFATSAAQLLIAASVGRLGTVLAASEPSQKQYLKLQETPWSDPWSLVSAIAAGTIAVPNVADSIEAYKKGFGYVEHWRGRVPAAMARFWGTPAMAGGTNSGLFPTTRRWVGRPWKSGFVQSMTWWTN
jgi:hypothetical protein